VFEWSDDDKVLVAPLPSTTKAPSHSTRAEEHSMGGEEVPQQRAIEIPEQQARGALER
jgi:hypothetical protein